METAVVQQFLDFFQDFINLCQSKHWPDNTTTEDDIRNAFIIAQHIEKCLDRLQKRQIINEFLSVLNSQDTSSLFFKSCLANPPKYILKKIIQSQTKITQMDVGFKIFIELFSNEKLENCLTDLMLETASKETLLKNLSYEIPKSKIIEFKSQILLSELNCNEDPKEVLVDLLKNHNQDTINLLVISLLNKEHKYQNSVTCIANAFTDVMLCKNHVNKSFWKSLFNVDDKHLLQLCLDHANLFKLIVKSLIDCSKLLRENMSAEYFYIDLTYSQLVLVVQRICKNDNLKIEFYDIVNEDSEDVTFWDGIIV